MYKLLLIEDDEKATAFLRSMLEPEGYELEAVSHGATALRLLYTKPFDGILLDLFNEDGLTGEDLVRVLRADEVLRHIPVILLTDIGSHEKKPRRTEHAAIFIPKPFSPEVFIRTLRHLFPVKDAKVFISKG